MTWPRHFGLHQFQNAQSRCPPALRTFRTLWRHAGLSQWLKKVNRIQGMGLRILNSPLGMEQSCTTKNPPTQRPPLKSYRKQKVNGSEVSLGEAGGQSGRTRCESGRPRFRLLSHSTVTGPWASGSLSASVFSPVKNFITAPTPHDFWR